MQNRTGPIYSGMPSSHTSESLTATQQMIASCTGAVAVSLFSTPFDVVKVRLQAQLKPTSKCFLFSNGLMDHVCRCGIPPALTKVLKSEVKGRTQTVYFTSTFDAFIKIVKYEGILQLWRGLPPTMVMAVPQTVVYFTMYDQLKEKLGWKAETKNLLAPSVSGMIARAFAVTAISPLEMIRTKLQARNGHGYKELFGVVRTAVRQEGWTSLWRGMGPTLLRDLPFSGLYWCVYEHLKMQHETLTFSVTFTAGATAGTLAALLTTPFDVIKTHRQIELGESIFGNKVNPSTWTVTLLLKLRKETGLRSLFTGVVPRLVKVAPACAIMISTYEYGKQYFVRKNQVWKKLESP